MCLVQWSRLEISGESLFRYVGDSLMAKDSSKNRDIFSSNVKI